MKLCSCLVSVFRCWRERGQYMLPQPSSHPRVMCSICATAHDCHPAFRFGELNPSREDDELDYPSREGVGTLRRDYPSGQLVLCARGGGNDECEAMNPRVWLLNLGVPDIRRGGRGQTWPWPPQAKLGGWQCLTLLKASSSQI